MSDWQIEQNIRRIAAEKVAGTYVPPPRRTKPKDSDDDVEEDGQMERQRRQARERRLAAEAVITPAVPTDTPEIARARAFYEGEEAQVRKQKKIGASPIAQRVAELHGNDRRCDVSGCGINTDGMSSLCKTHKRKKVTYGHPKATVHLRYKEYAPYVGLAVKHFKENPPPPVVLESVTTFLIPPPFLKAHEKGAKKRSLVTHEMLRWQDPHYRKKLTHYGNGDRKANYSPRGYLAVLVAIAAFIEEREGRGFPGDPPEMEQAFALCRRHKRPGRLIGRTKPVKSSQRISGTVLRGVSKRLREYPRIGVYALTTAREILAQQAAQRAEQNAKLAKAVPRLPTHEEYQKMIERPAGQRLFDPDYTPPPKPIPTDPGPRPAGHAMESHVQAWAKKFADYESYQAQQRRKDK